MNKKDRTQLKILLRIYGHPKAATAIDTLKRTETNFKTVKTEYDLTELAKQKQENLLAHLINFFVWDATPQGHKYWDTLHNELTIKQQQ